MKSKQNQTLSLKYSVTERSLQTPINVIYHSFRLQKRSRLKNYGLYDTLTHRKSGSVTEIATKGTLALIISYIAL
jgi:hypothetical protein